MQRACRISGAPASTSAPGDAPVRDLEGQFVAAAPQGNRLNEERMQLPVIRTYLEMATPPDRRPDHAVARPGVAIRRLEPCPVGLYRMLYGGVGGPWHWYERLGWSDEALSVHLGRPEVEVHLLEVGGQPAGYFELDRHPDKGTEIAYFGLMPGFIGQGFGAVAPPPSHRERLGGAPSKGLAAHLYTGPSGGPAQLPEARIRGDGNRGGTDRLPK